MVDYKAEQCCGVDFFKKNRGSNDDTSLKLIFREMSRCEVTLSELHATFDGYLAHHLMPVKNIILKVIENMHQETCDSTNPTKFHRGVFKSRNGFSHISTKRHARIGLQFTLNRQVGT